MNITEVRIRIVNQGKLKAFAEVVFEGCFAIHDIKIIESRSGLFLAMPNRKLANGDHQDIAHPVNEGMRKRMEDIVLREYVEELQKWKSQRQGRDEGDDEGTAESDTSAARRN